MPRFPVPDGGDRGDLAASRRSSAACSAALPGGTASRRAPRAGRVRGRRHRPDGLPRLLPGRRRPGAATRRTTASGSARAAARPPASIVAYALGITELDPIQHGLLFERFLNPERISMPDIDLDFDERRRGDMIRYATEKYGEDRVARSSPTARSRPSRRSRTPPGCSASRSPWATGSPRRCRRRSWARTSRSPASSTATTRATARRASSARSTSPTPRSSGSSTPRAGSRASSASGACTPPASSCPASRCIDVIPIMRREQDGAIITQFDMGACETLGLLKMDFLGLRNLTVLDDCLRNIEANRGETIVLETLAARRHEGLRAAGPRRHPRRLPARRRADALAAARRCGPTTSRTSPPSSRSTGPARWAPTRTTTTPTARTAASRSCRSTPSSRSRSPRSSATPTA